MAIKKTIKNERHQVIHPITEVSAVEGLSEALAQKQDLLNSGVNIKTINGESILGPGNMIIDGGGSTISVDTEMSDTSENPVQNKVITQAISGFITKSVDDLVNYYLKSETYNKTEVDSLIAAVNQFTYEVAASLPTASASTMYKIYLIPSSRPETQNVKDEYITIRSGSEGSYTYSWEQIGSTAIDLSDYVTTSALNAALASYTTTAQLNTLLAAKQDVINDLSTIRSGAAAGATAYQKPSGGIPKTDLNSGVQASLDLADSAVQADPVGSVTPPVTPSDWATAEQAEELEVKVTDNTNDIDSLQNQLDNYQPIVIEGNVTNAPDEEDITTDENDLLKFANRAAHTNYLGYVILRKGKTFASQVTVPNTIYEIRYDFDLNNAEVTIPAGCMLKFNGGCLSNGKIIGNNTSLSLHENCAEQLVFGGAYLLNDVAKASIFKTWDSSCFQSLVNICSEDGVVSFDANFVYTVSETVSVSKSITIFGNGKEISNTKDNYYTNRFLNVGNAEHFHLYDLKFNGNSQSANGRTWRNENLINIVNVAEVIIDGCEFYNFVIDFNDWVLGRLVEGFRFEDYLRCEFTNNKIYNCSMPEGLAFHPNQLLNILPTQMGKYHGGTEGIEYKQFVNPEQHLDDYNKCNDFALVKGNYFNVKEGNPSGFNGTCSGYINVFFGICEICNNTLIGAGVSSNALCFNSTIHDNFLQNFTEQAIDLTEDYMFYYVAKSVTISNNIIKSTHSCPYIIGYTAFDVHFVGNKMEFTNQDSSAIPFLFSGDGLVDSTIKDNTIQGCVLFTRSTKLSNVRILHNNVNVYKTNNINTGVISFSVVTKDVEISGNTFNNFNGSYTIVSGTDRMAIFKYETASGTVLKNLRITNNIITEDTYANDAPIFICVVPNVRSLSYLAEINGIYINGNVYGNTYNPGCQIILCSNTVDAFDSDEYHGEILGNSFNIVGLYTNIPVKLDGSLISGKTNNETNIQSAIKNTGLFVPKGTTYQRTSRSDSIITTTADYAYVIRTFADGYCGAFWLIRHNEYVYMTLIDVSNIDFTDAETIPQYNLIRVGTFQTDTKYILYAGTTALRPSVKRVGQTYFDADLGKMIVWNGSAWVNMDGTALS